MVVMTSAQFCERLKYLAMKRKSRYSNKYPYNCLYINAGEIISADCTGLIKSLINDPTAYKRTSPIGWYVTPGQNIPDTTVKGILNLCSGKSNDFKSIVPGEYLAMLGADGNKHAGVYVGEFNDGGICNTVESTGDWSANKITTSYTDENGNRYNHKGGTKAPSKWDYHAKLSRYVSYDAPKDNRTWVKKWYLYDGNKMLKGWQKVKNVWYYLDDKTGEMLTGWQKLKWSKGEDWFYFDDSGKMLTGWQQLKWSKGTNWFYFYDTGAMATGTVTIDGKTYKFDDNGVWIDK